MGLDDDSTLLPSALSVSMRGDIPWNDLNNTVIVITGSTGLIGSQIVRVLCARNIQFNAGISLVLPVRNIDKALNIFGDQKNISYIEWDLNIPLILPKGCDFFIHAACDTSSGNFLIHPTETLLTILNGTRHTLQAAKEAFAKKYVFLSTMEVYGEMSGYISEQDFGRLDPMIVRNSYPEAKRMSECLCASYYSEFSLPTVVLRLAQTFGQGVSIEDSRVFAEFGRIALKEKNIVLYSDGKKKNMYLSINDAVAAILVALIKGEAGNAYNVANETTYCSIKDMANMVLREFGSQDAIVTRGFDSMREASFRKSADLALDCSKFRELGWSAHDSLEDMYREMLSSWSRLE